MSNYDINKPFWQSKKWIMTVIAVIIPILNGIFDLGLNSDEILSIAAPIVVYVLAQGCVDSKR